MGLMGILILTVGRGGLPKGTPLAEGKANSGNMAAATAQARGPSGGARLCTLGPGRADVYFMLLFSVL